MEYEKIFLKGAKPRVANPKDKERDQDQTNCRKATTTTESSG